MRLSKKLAVGAAAGVLPFLIGQSPAGAVVKSDESEQPVSFTSTSGTTVRCRITALHTVDTDSGRLEVNLTTGTPSSDADPCRADLLVVVEYVDRNGDEVRSLADAFGTVSLRLGSFNAGSSAVNAFYSVDFTDCATSCARGLETQTNKRRQRALDNAPRLSLHQRSHPGRVSSK